MKSLYIIKPSERTFAHIEEAFKVKAIDSVLFSIYAVPDDTQQPWEDSYEQGVEAIKKIGQYGPVYPVVLWQRQMLPNSHILNEPQQRIMAALRLVNDTNVSGIVWDVEDYRAGANAGRQNPVPKQFGQWCREAGLPVIGAMPNNQGIGGRYFDERTYDGEDGWWNCLKYKLRRFFGSQERLPGIWVERFHDPTSYIKEMNDCRGGYWIYSHVRFGQRVNSSHKRWYINDSPLPFVWWHNLKRETT